MRTDDTGAPVIDHEKDERLHYAGDQRHAIGDQMGPDIFGGYVWVKGAEYEPPSKEWPRGRTTLYFSRLPVSPDEAAAGYRAAIERTYEAGGHLKTVVTS
jgi:hypothetical protein